LKNSKDPDGNRPCIRITDQDPDPGGQLVTDPPDLDPQHCLRTRPILGWSLVSLFF